MSFLVLAAYGGLLYLTYYGFAHTPSGFIPSQDKGYLLVNVRLPDATSVESTQGVMRPGRGAGQESAGRERTPWRSRGSRCC